MRDGDSAGVIICRVGPDRFALPVALVREVVAVPAIARLPGAPPGVLGMANVRGRLVTAFSGALLFGHEGGGAAPWLVVLTMRQGRVGLEVDEVEDLQSAGAGHDVPLLDVAALIRPLLAADAAEG
jgi:purine-binding chemotaxis protein CheW